MSNKELIDRLAAHRRLSVDEFEELLSTYAAEDRDHATSRAYKASRDRFGSALYAWGVIEITNVCAKECFYCGLCRSNEGLERYRLTTDEILERCAEGHALGFRTFVLQAGEDPELTDDVAYDLIWAISKKFPDCAIALAFGEKSRGTYQRYFDAGADRYLLRHETADAEHFALLHPRRVTLANRIRCLEDLQAVGFQTGCGMMVGTPFQTPRHLAQDLAFIADFRPAIVTIAPFLPAATTKFADHPAGPLGLTLFVLSLVRLILPDALLPATSALAASHSRGHELAVMAGANVVMPNLTPPEHRAKYAPYDAKLTAGPEIAEGLEILAKRMDAIGYQLVPQRGDYDPHARAAQVASKKRSRSPESP